MRRVIGTLLAVVLAVGAFAAPAAAQEPPSLAAQILADADGEFDRNWYDFDIIGEVVAALLGAADEGLIETQLGAAALPLADLQAAGLDGLTVFLPNDRAFQLLAFDLSGKWLRNEAQVIPAILDAVGGDLQLVNTIVEYHVVPGTIDSAAAVASDGAVLPTVSGFTFEVDVRESRWFGPTIRLIDNDPDDFNPFVIRSKVDNFAGNGVWHGISQVLRPIDVGTKFEFIN
jgi:uncharacterized surface protein with fasciclin (FAS1) repeats